MHTVRSAVGDMATAAATASYRFANAVASVRPSDVLPTAGPAVDRYSMRCCGGPDDPPPCESAYALVTTSVLCEGT